MLHDMPKSRSTALVADPEDAVGAVAGSHAGGPPAKTSRPSRAPRVKIVKQGALGALLRPIGISIALILSAYAIVSLGTILGPAVEADKVVEAVDALVATYLEARESGERFVDTYRRIGAQPFKERVYGTV